MTLTASATITDGDGDTATDSEVVDLGGNIRFADDGPSVDVTATNEAAIVLTTQDAETDGVPTSEDTAVSTANFSGVFCDRRSVYGADGAGHGADAELCAEPCGRRRAARFGPRQQRGEICLLRYRRGDHRLDRGDDGEVTAGNTIFSIAVSGTGVVTLTQFAEIDHAAAGRDVAPV